MKRAFLNITLALIAAIGILILTPATAASAPTPKTITVNDPGGNVTVTIQPAEGATQADVDNVFTKLAAAIVSSPTMKDKVIKGGQKHGNKLIVNVFRDSNDVSVGGNNPSNSNIVNIDLGDIAVIRDCLQGEEQDKDTVLANEIVRVLTHEVNHTTGAGDPNTEEEAKDPNYVAVENQVLTELGLGFLRLNYGECNYLTCPFQWLVRFIMTHNLKIVEFNVTKFEAARNRDKKVYEDLCPCVTAQNPSPADGTDYVSKNAILKWNPGNWAKTTGGHDVYFGTAWADVNSATTATAGIFKGTQDANSYDPCAGELVLGKTYYWRIDEVNENYVPGPNDPPVPPNGRWKGDVWSFTVEGRARNPYPADGAIDVPKNIILRWVAGTDAKYHRVYLGTDPNDMPPITILNKGTEQYDTSSLNLQVCKYFWRVDEINTMTVKGYVWDFTVANWILIEDFDFYSNTTAMRVNWKDSSNGAGGGGSVWVNLDANFAVDGNSMRFEYYNDAGSYYSETKRSYSKAQNWTYAGNGVTLMEINFFGDANNVATKRILDPPMYVKLYDGTKTAQVNYPDINDCLEEALHTWNIPLKNFSDKGVTLSKISSITLGMGDKKGVGGIEELGTVYFDDIILWPPRCFPEYGPVADFTDDCNVDNYDLDIMATDWLVGDYYAKTEKQNGTLTNFPTDNSQWIADGRINGALKFDGVDDYVHVTDPRLVGITSMTISAWVRQSIDNEWTGIVTSRETIAGTEQCAEIGLYGAGYGGPGGLGYDWSWAAGDPWKFDAGLDVPTTNTWTFVALSVDPTGATLYMKPVGSALSKGLRDVRVEPPLKTFSQYFDISRSNPTGGFHKGDIDDVRIYNRNLDDANIALLANETGEPNPGPVYWYKLNETSGSTAADSGYGATLYIQTPSVANLTDPEAEGDRAVNLRDYAMLADEWLVETLWPLP